MKTTTGLSKVYPGEVDQLLIPTNYSSPKYPCIMVHGAEAGPGALDWMVASVNRWKPYWTYVDVCGCVGLSADLGGNATWGNNTVQSRLDSAYNYLQTLPNVKKGKVVLVAQSMGGINALVWAKNNPSKVACIVGHIPVTNLTFAWQHGVYTSAINAAYGGAYSEAAYGANHNPTTFGAALNGVHAQLWVGDTDPLARLSDAQALAALAPSIIVKPISGGHEESTISNMNLAEVAAFVNTYA